MWSLPNRSLRPGSCQPQSGKNWRRRLFSRSDPMLQGRKLLLSVTFPGRLPKPDAETAFRFPGTNRVALRQERLQVLRVQYFRHDGLSFRRSASRL